MGRFRTLQCPASSFQPGCSTQSWSFFLHRSHCWEPDPLFRIPTPRSRAARVDGMSRLQPGQRRAGIILVFHATRAPRPPPLAVASQTRQRDVRVDRRLVQSPPTPHRARNAVTPPVRNSSHRRFRGGIIQPATTARETGTGSLGRPPRSGRPSATSPSPKSCQKA